MKGFIMCKTPKHLMSETAFIVRGQVVFPVDGEEFFGQLGLSHGIIHFQDPISKECIGHCDINYFDLHAYPSLDQPKV